MAERDGDGWVECRCGSKHWGKHGAAGIVLIDPETTSVLMQLRAEWTHGGRVWGIPGGARDSHENAVESALREMHEELSIHPDSVTVIVSVRSPLFHSYPIPPVAVRFTDTSPQNVNGPSAVMLIFGCGNTVKV